MNAGLHKFSMWNGLPFYHADVEKMPASHQGKTLLRMAVSTGVLFSDDCPSGLKDHEQDTYHNQKLSTPLPLGPGFPLVYKLLRLNEFFPDEYMKAAGDSAPILVDIVTQRRPDTPFHDRFLLSLLHYGAFDLHHGWGEKHFLGDEEDPRMWENGDPVSMIVPSLKAIGAHVYLGANRTISEQVLQSGLLALLFDQRVSPNMNLISLQRGLKVAYDVDNTALSRETDHIYINQGLEAAKAHEKCHINRPLETGTAYDFLKRLSLIRSLFPKRAERDPESGMLIVSPITLGPCTLRGNTHHWIRSTASLKHHGLARDFEINSYGANKATRLSFLKPDVLIDDSEFHIESVNGCGIPGAHIITTSRN